MKNDGLRIPVRSKKNRQEKDSCEKNDKEKVIANIQREADVETRLSFSLIPTVTIYNDVDCIEWSLSKVDPFLPDNNPCSKNVNMENSLIPSLFRVVFVNIALTFAAGCDRYVSLCCYAECL